MNFLAAIGQTLAGASADVQAAQDAATQAFYVIAGELLLVVLLLGFIAWKANK
ncbi:MAG TPA: hypothetical protein VKP61_15040 [Candidatus Acidoferrum sp.]|nr:hypothetical protein [Candidatus Acidoferrum sp.]